VLLRWLRVPEARALTRGPNLRETLDRVGHLLAPAPDDHRNVRDIVG
jgi:hypothetical protein